MVPRALRHALAFALLLVAALSYFRHGPPDFAPLPEAPPAVSTPAMLDPNTATREQLESLPGVGPTLAQRIVEARPYARVDELRRVRGIGERTLARFRDRLRLAADAGVARGPAGS
ncbi:MAG: helix-hairpin-helix motif protein [Myxococcaceae bacterium]|nr:helix-hairpin-helix motif protein [Myxococcaceae bacterium]